MTNKKELHNKFFNAIKGRLYIDTDLRFDKCDELAESLVEVELWNMTQEICELEEENEKLRNKIEELQGDIPE